MEISDEILNSFNLSGDIVALKGGQNSSLRVNNAVLKPVDDSQHCEWLLNILCRIKPQGYRISKPIRSNNGTFVSKGWACTHYESGQDKVGCVESKLQVSRLFHRDLSFIHFEDSPPVDNPWSKGHRIAWQLDELPRELPKEIKQIINNLLNRVSLKDGYKVQIVHSDLSGNILFDPILSPLVIDFSPTIAPVEYAEAILVCDCIAWQGSKVSEIDLLPNDKIYREMIIRAIIFRLATSVFLSKSEYNNFFNDYQAFRPIIEYITD